MLSLLGGGLPPIFEDAFAKEKAQECKPNVDEQKEAKKLQQRFQFNSKRALGGLCESSGKALGRLWRRSDMKIGFQMRPRPLLTFRSRF